MALINKTQEEYYLGPDGVWDSNDENYGGYQFVSISDIINNFMVVYVGEEKIITKVNVIEKFPTDKNVTKIAIIIPAIPK